MNKTSNGQPDLFLGAQDDPDLLSKRIERNSFVARIWKYEKSILLILGFMVVGVISYSLGVEKGRQDLVSAKTVRAGHQLVAAKEMAAPAPLVTPVPKRQEELFSVQVATFNARSHAQREVESLARKGFKAFILAKGKYFVVCVGKFSDKSSAQPVLSELSRNYKGCYIRRM